MIKGAIFDFDGTLVDSMFIWDTIGEVYLRSLGKEPKENLAETFKTFTLEQSAEYYREHYGVMLPVRKIIDDVNATVAQIYQTQVTLKDGAKEFLDELRSLTQVIIISDTFTQFAAPLMKKLGMPTIFCNTLEVAPDGEITGFRMRCDKSKLSTVKALQSVGFETIAAGDSFNDLGMIQASKAGFLFRSTDKIKADYPELPAYEEYDELLTAIKFAL